jgi:hypothetical protein
MAVHKGFEHKSATILDVTSVSSRRWDDAIKQVAAGFSKEQSRSNTAYAIVVHQAKRKASGPSYLATARIFARAYKLGLQAMSGVKGEILKSRPGARLTILNPEAHIRLFVGDKPSPKEIRAQIVPRPGIYIIGSHLNAGILADLALPPAPQLLLDVPVVIQVEEPALKIDEVEAILGGLPDSAGTVSVVADPVVADPVSAVDRDSLVWRQQFMSEYPRWVSADIAQQSTSLAKNQASTASRWAKEKKVFGIDYQGQKWFPTFQFQDGRPIPEVSQVLEVFPKHATGWQLAYFFTAANANISGRKPYELLKTDPSRVVSLARAFVHPADVF